VVTLTSSIGAAVNNGDGTWSWSFPADGSTLSQIVTVFADDGFGGMSQMAFNLAVNNVAPTVNAGPDVTLIQGQTFTTTGSFGDPGPDMWTAAVDYGDGSGAQALVLTGQTFTLNYLYAAEGVYIVTASITDDDGGVGVDTLAVTVRSPQDATGDLIQRIPDLVNRGVLNGGQGNALIAKLEAAIQQLDRGNITTAINQLEAFVNQVSALMNSGVLPPAEGQPLIDAANAILDALGH